MIDRENLMNFRQKITLSILPTLVLASVAFAQVVEIPDPNLRTAVRHTLNLADDTPLTQAAMKRLTDSRLVICKLRD